MPSMSYFAILGKFSSQKDFAMDLFPPHIYRIDENKKKRTFPGVVK